MKQLELWTLEDLAVLEKISADQMFTVYEETIPDMIDNGPSKSEDRHER